MHSTGIGTTAPVYWTSGAFLRSPFVQVKNFEDIPNTLIATSKGNTKDRKQAEDPVKHEKLSENLPLIILLFSSTMPSRLEDLARSE